MTAQPESVTHSWISQADPRPVAIRRGGRRQLQVLLNSWVSDQGLGDLDGGRLRVVVEYVAERGDVSGHRSCVIEVRA
jgi:hypothetical protein